MTQSVRAGEEQEHFHVHDDTVPNSAHSHRSHHMRILYTHTLISLVRNGREAMKHLTPRALNMLQIINPGAL